MILIRAAWVCPIAGPPLANGWVAVEGGRIVAVGGPASPAPAGAGVRDLGQVAVLPGLVNAHTHLELSWLRDRVPPAASFIAWLTGMFAARGGTIERADDPRVVDAARLAAREAHDAGTIAVGDISNSLASIGPIADAGLSGIVFHELLGFSDTTGWAIERTSAARDAAPRHAEVRVSLAPHAPYSVSPELMQAVRRAVDASDVRVTSTHIGESAEEIEMLLRGTGPWPAILRRLGVWREDWTPPATGPVEYLDSLGVLTPGTLVVHGVQLSAASLATLAARGCVLVTCPRSNQWVGVGVPPLERFYESGVDVAIGTDSLASVGDLNLFAELKEMRWLAPRIPASRFLESATIQGARALQLDTELGTIEAGKRASLIAVTLPAAMVDDVEEYLVSGIEPRQVEWIVM
jgi:cytosine/adenosine deaminase-related metal-dependent hydrolase